MPIDFRNPDIEKHKVRPHTVLVGRLTVQVHDRLLTQALAIARAEQPDLLILDINMPAGSGISVQQRIQAIDKTITPPVIFITGNGITEPISEEISQRNARILQKPIETIALLATVRECQLEYAK